MEDTKFRAPLGAALRALEISGRRESLTEALLTEAARFAEEVIAPLNGLGDREGAKLEHERVTMPKGYKEAWTQFVQAGWPAMGFPESLGGQGLAPVVCTAASEFWHGASLAFGLCPMLTEAAARMVAAFGSPELKSIYLSKLISAVWTGTMCMTEPQAGSDVGAVRTEAVPSGDHYLIRGNKIFITFGDHDMAENIIHVVLARIPGAPSGVKGISVFLVPKYLVKEDGSLGEENGVLTLALERKMGLHASPTASLQFGGKGNTKGWLIGEANAGLSQMFLMMNHARLGVGMEGIAVAGQASAMAQAYAEERIQSGSTIERFSDVQRMLLTMAAHANALRLLSYEAALAVEYDDERAALLTPIVKAWGSEMGFENASLAMQVYGGMGYIEESGVPQLMRDVRVSMIYEGTNGIQARDFALRKLDKHSEAFEILLGEITMSCDKLLQSGEDVLEHIGARLDAATARLRLCHLHLEGLRVEGRELAEFAAMPMLRMTALTLEAWALTKAVFSGQPEHLGQLRFFADHILPETTGLAESIVTS